ncbi:MAG: hypothetical protein IJ677_06700 [Alphaproteobacteria bacterium]|nr:hypothetical protein [Alphaproteobacteria bacterium]
MIKNKIIKFIFSLFVSLITIYPEVSYAEAQCSPEQIEQAEAKAKKYATDSISAFLNAVGPFNTAAKNYITQCKQPELMKDSSGNVVRYAPNNSVAARASVLKQASFKNSGNFEYLNYNWAQEVVPSGNENCSKLLKAVKDAKVPYDEALSAAETTTLRTMNRAYIMCTCSEQSTQEACASAADEEGAQGAGSCKTFAQYQQELNVCPLCGIFKVILKTIAGVSTKAWNAVAAPLSNVVKIFFLVLLALEVLKAVAAVAGSKISSLAKGVLLLCLKIAITLQLLSTPKYIYGYFLSPVIEGGLNMGLRIANASGPGANVVVSADDRIEIPSDTFSPSVYDSVMATVRNFGVAASTLPAIGRGLTCYALDAGHLGFPSLGMWLSGVLMYVFGLMIWLAISFYMIDCTVQIGMLSGLVPLLIACWPFKLTEAYTFKGCKMLMNSFFSYVMLGVVLLLGTMITTHAATGDGSNINEIIGAINNNDIDALKKMCSLDAFQILILASCCIFAMKLIGQVNDLADQFSKGAGSNIGNKMGGLALSAATNSAKSGFKTALRGAGSVVKHGAAATGVTAGINKGVDAVKGGWQKGWSAAGKTVGLGKYQNQQASSDKESDNDNKESKEDKGDTMPENTEVPTSEAPTSEQNQPETPQPENPLR